MTQGRAWRLMRRDASRWVGRRVLRGLLVAAGLRPRSRSPGCSRPALGAMRGRRARTSPFGFAGVASSMTSSGSRNARSLPGPQLTTSASPSRVRMRSLPSSPRTVSTPGSGDVGLREREQHVVAGAADGRVGAEVGEDQVVAVAAVLDVVALARRPAGRCRPRRRTCRCPGRRAARSRASPPKSWSSPGPPQTLVAAVQVADLRRRRRAGCRCPRLPRMRSLPARPLMVSSPSLPNRRSKPWRPTIVSLPRPPIDQVVAEPGVDGVVAGRGEHAVAPVAHRDRVVTVEREDAVVAAHADDLIGVARTVDAVVARGPVDDQREGGRAQERDQRHRHRDPQDELPNMEHCPTS